METDAAAALGEELALRERIYAPRQVASAEQRSDARDVGLERGCHHVPVQPDVLVELLRDPRRQIELGHLTAGLRRDLNAPLDLSDLVGVLVDRSDVTRSELLSKSRELLHQRVQDALALF